jgi:hypothetical protein
VEEAHAAEGTGGLEDRPKPGKLGTVDDVAIVLATLEPPPKMLASGGGATPSVSVKLLL